MKNLKNILLLSLFFVVIFAKTSDYIVKNQVAIELNNNGNTVIVKESDYSVPQTRGEFDLYVEDFESGAEGWTTGAGWQLTTSNSNSETHSMQSPNTDATFDNVWDMMSPQIDLPALGEGETMGFTFWIYGDTPDTDGNGDNYLEDYYQVSVMDIDALAWQATNFDSYDGNSYWCGDSEIGGYLDSWIQFLDTPSFTVPSGASLTADLKWSIEDPAGAVVAGTCTDGWDAANVRISSDGGESWDLLTATGLGDAYDFDCGYGWLWNSADYDTNGPLNNLAAGWGGVQDWKNFEFDLSSYAGDEVIVRFAFGSDPAYCTLDDGDITGFHVDNIVVSGGALDCTPENNCDISVNGAVWVDQFYDYVDTDRPGYQTWEQYVAGLPFNGNVFMDISDFAEKSVTFRFQSRYDGDHDGGQGDGLFIDDFRIFKTSACGTPPQDLAGEAGDGLANLSWEDMNESGDDVEFDWTNGSFSEQNGITINGEGDAWAAEKFEFYGTSTINSVEVYSINTVPVDVQVGAFGQLGTLYDSQPLYSVSATLDPGWNSIDVGDGWDMTTSFLIGYTFSATVTAGLDGSGVSENSMVMLNAGWDTWEEIATASALPQGEWGVRANISYDSPNATYNVYVDGLLNQSDLTDNSATVSGLDNNVTYNFTATANFDCGESDSSESIEVTPQPQTTVEYAHDDGSAEEFYNAGSSNFTAVKFSATGDLVRFKWLQDGDGGAFYLKMFADEGGMPGEETYSKVLAGTLADGWNTYDLSAEGLTVSGTFWIGTKEFSSTQGLGLDTSSDAGKSYSNTIGAWEAVPGNLMIRVFVDGDGCTPGDANGDLIINVLDIVGAVGDVLAGGEVNNPCLDMNGDGTMNVLDIVAIVGLVLGG